MHAETQFGPQPDLLNSWKEIAAYLGRDVSTAKRWETSRHLPVHRIPGGKRDAIYALKSELEAWRRFEATTAQDAAGPSSASSTQSLPHLKPYMVALGATLLVAAGISAWVSPRWTESPVLRFAPLSSLSGDEVDPALSGDGNYVAFAYRPEGTRTYSLYLGQTGGAQPLRLTDTPAHERFPQFSPDSSRLAFIRAAGAAYSVWTMHALGGGERKIADLAWSGPAFEKPLAWSVDGKALVVAEEDRDSKVMALHSIHLGTGRRIRLTDPPAGTFGDGQPAWSPDGQQIAFLRQSPSRIKEVWITSTSGGGGAENHVRSARHHRSGMGERRQAPALRLGSWRARSGSLERLAAWGLSGTDHHSASLFQKSGCLAADRARRLREFPDPGEHLALRLGFRRAPALEAHHLERRSVQSGIFAGWLHDRLYVRPERLDGTLGSAPGRFRGPATHLVAR